MISETADKRNAGQHRVRGTDRGKECRARDVRVGDLMKAAVGSVTDLFGIVSHTQRAGLVMGRAEAVAAAAATRVRELIWQNRRQRAGIDARRNHLPIFNHIDLCPLAKTFATSSDALSITFHNSASRALG